MNINKFKVYLEPTNIEIKKMIVCGQCKYNKPCQLHFSNYNLTLHKRFCHKNFHYVENNTIELTCYFNKQHLLKNTFLNRVKLKIRKLCQLNNFVKNMVLPKNNSLVKKI
jgi:hypothetical protein